VFTPNSRFSYPAGDAASKVKVEGNAALATTSVVDLDPLGPLDPLDPELPAPQAAARTLTAAVRAATAAFLPYRRPRTDVPDALS
jgi:hypothetical protein